MEVFTGVEGVFEKHKDVSLILATIVWSNSGAANDHVTAFFEDRPTFSFSADLGYSLLKNAPYPNLWPPYGGIWSNSIILSFMGKYS